MAVNKHNTSHFQGYIDVMHDQEFPTNDRSHMTDQGPKAQFSAQSFEGEVIVSDKVCLSTLLKLDTNLNKRKEGLL